jgi:hypothetical protein
MSRRLIRGFEADIERSSALSVAIAEAHSRLPTWAVTIEMTFASINEIVQETSLYRGNVWPISATGRPLGGEAEVEALASMSDEERAVLDGVLLPIEFAERLNLTPEQANAAALRVAAHRVAAPELPPADLTADLGEPGPRPHHYCVARWQTAFRASNRNQARSIANLLASTVVDHTGCPRGQITELEWLEPGGGYDDNPPSEWDPYDEIGRIADHAANVAALKRPMLMAGAFLLRAWNIEANEYQGDMEQRYRNLVGHPDRKLVSPQQLHEAGMRARLRALGRSSDELMRLAQQRRHQRSLYFPKFWTVDLDELRQWALLQHEADVLEEMAREVDAAHRRLAGQTEHSARTPAPQPEQ